MSKSLIVDKIQSLSSYDTYATIAQALKTVQWHAIDQSPWLTEYPYEPQAKFQIAYTTTHIVLHYDIQEEYVKAQYIRPNENVWEDSCVEFFLSLDGKENYYNFEFNVLGTGLIGYGPAVKSLRSRLSADEIEQVDVLTQIRKIGGKKQWSAILFIPVALFGGVSLEGNTFHGNFYKCGDGLPKPHFIAWSNIDLPSPSFHQPSFFGELKFK